MIWRQLAGCQKSVFQLQYVVSGSDRRKLHSSIEICIQHSRDFALCSKDFQALVIRRRLSLRQVSDACTRGLYRKGLIDGNTY